MRSRAVRDALEIIGAVWFLMKGDTGLVRGLELYLVTDCGGEDCARSETQDKGKAEGNTERDATGGMMYGEMHQRGSPTGELYAALSAPAAATRGCLWRLPSGLQPWGDLVGLLEIFVSRAPEDQAAGDSPDGDRNPALCDDVEDAVFHRGWAGALRGALSQILLRGL